MTQKTELVPDIGSDVAEVVEILVSAGDSVDVDQGLIVLESDKASMEVPSSVAGTVVDVLVKEGDELSEGGEVAVIEVAEGADAGATPSEAEETTPQTNTETKQASSTDAADSAADVKAVSSAPSGEEANATREVTVPDIGTDDAVDLVEISVAIGDRVDEGDTLVVLESDKASMEVPSPTAGVVEALRVQDGQQVSQGDVLLVLSGAAALPASTTEASESAAPETPARTSSEVATSGPAPATASTASGGPSTAGGEVYAGPAVRKLAREFGVPLRDVKGTGPKGRIVKEDLHEFVKRRLDRPAGAGSMSGIPDVPEVDFAAFGDVEVVERSRIDKVTAANMHRSWLNVPHVTQFDDADITELEAFRKSLRDEGEKRGTRLTPVPFLLKACAVALSRHEKINASLSDGGDTLTLKRYVHIGMAVDTPAGLVVPVIRDVDHKSIWDLAAEVLDLAARARDRKLKPAEMQGACFTISSLGAIGGRGFTPIVNTPEVAILGVSRAQTQPVWDGSAFQPRLQLPLSLSYDHRVVNGGDAGRFLTELCELLGDIRRLVL